jgi:ribose transport system permease protein
MLKANNLSQNNHTWLRNSIRSIPPVFYFLIIVFALFATLDQIFADGQMLTNPNIMMNIIIRGVALGIVAIGQTFVLIGASIDLSVVYVISVTSVLSSYFMQGDPANVPIAVIIVFIAGAIVGLINGLIITKLKINAFITTLGTSLILKGIINASFQNFAGEVPRSFEVLGYGRIGPIPISVIILLSITFIGWFILTRTRFGAHLYAVGGNVEVARLSGLRTDRILIIAHVICSITAVLTGLFVVSRIRAGAPWIGPDGVYDLESIATTVIGGTALSGGRGGVLGTLAGVLIFGVLGYSVQPIGSQPLSQECHPWDDCHYRGCQLHHPFKTRNCIKWRYP